jgi:hypothetical protein
MKSCENRLSIFSVVTFAEGLEKLEREKKSMVDVGARGEVRIVEIVAGKFSG